MVMRVLKCPAVCYWPAVGRKRAWLCTTAREDRKPTNFEKIFSILNFYFQIK
jgi:hypothetical protein